jgi:GTP-binding protein
MNLQPVIALCGRPNVGKSTLFNRLVRDRTALVADVAGLTRDRIYGAGKVGDKPYMVVDTGGLVSGKGETVQQLSALQVTKAIREADAVLVIVDTRAGLTTEDEHIAARIRQFGKPMFLVANKTEGLPAEQACAEFHGLGLGTVYPISAAHGQGVQALMDAVLETLPAAAATEEQEDRIRIAVTGRPNVGKSTLINRILGEDRVVTSDEPGTTRDSIYIPFDRGERHHTLIDTAGVRRRARLTEKVEKFSVLKTLQAVEAAHVVILVLDARQEVSDQDAKLLDTVLDGGKGLVIAVNKWDGLTPERRRIVKDTLQRKLSFFTHAEVHYISALHGSGVGTLLDAVDRAYDATMRHFATPQLTRVLEEAVTRNPPPLVAGRRIKLRYAHQGGKNPPVIVIHGNQVQAVPETYRRYLTNFFIHALKLEGTPLRVEFKRGTNPYSGKGRARGGGSRGAGRRMTH